MTKELTKLIEKEVLDVQDAYYLSGPMTGIADYNFPEFNRVANILRGKGVGIINPAENFNGDTTLDYDTYIRLDLIAVALSKGVVLLKGHDYSKGCAKEKQVARMLNLPIFEYVEGDLFNPLKPYTLKEPASAAFQICEDIMHENLKKHAAGTWRDEPTQHHLLRAGRHAITTTDLLGSDRKYDGESCEDHAKRIIVRAAMAYCTL